MTHDVCGPDARPVTFEVTAVATTCLLPRVLQVLARRDVMPAELRARCVQGRMEVRVHCEALADMDRRTIEGSLRQLIGLHRVEVALHPRRLRRAA